MDRLSVPGQINQFTHTLEKDQAAKLFKLLAKYTPESKKDKRQRLKQEAANKAEGKEQKETEKPLSIKFGLNHITTLVENKQAKLVVMAHDVVPIELMVHVPTLCRKMGIPYCFVKNKARLGTLVHQKTATCVALTEVRKEDLHDLENLRTFFNGTYNENTGIRTLDGEPIMGIKNQQRRNRRGRKGPAKKQA
jgi:large subunit ribosomal protein L7Ae